MFPELTRDEVYRIETPRLWLRWPQLDDAVYLARWVGLPEVAPMTSTFSVGMTASQVAERVSEIRSANGAGQSLAFVLTLKGADTVAAGMLGVQVQPGGRLELGYHLDPALWGRGMMTEGVLALCAQAFELSAAASIAARVRPGNAASKRVLEKCAFKLVGHGVQETTALGRHNMQHYALPRQRPSALRLARTRSTAGPVLLHELVGLA